MKKKKKKAPRLRRPSASPSATQEAPLSKGRERAPYGTAGQNWTESHTAARRGRYAEENKLQGEEGEPFIDTDASGAV